MEKAMSFFFRMLRRMESHHPVKEPPFSAIDVSLLGLGLRFLSGLKDTGSLRLLGLVGN